MEPVEINISKEDLRQQLNFLIKQEFRITYPNVKKRLLYLAGFTIIILLSYLLEENPSIIIFKVVFTFFLAIAWLIALIFMITMAYKLYRRYRWREKGIKAMVKDASKKFIVFDENKVTLFSEIVSVDYKWEYFKYFANDSNSIYFFPEHDLYQTIYFSRNEIGTEHFERLRAMGESKLLLLEDYYRSPVTS